MLAAIRKVRTFALPIVVAVVVIIIKNNAYSAEMLEVVSVLFGLIDSLSCVKI